VTSFFHLLLSTSEYLYLMHTPLLIKIRIALVLAASVALFAFLGHSWAHAWDSKEALTILLQHQPTRLIWISLGLVILSTLIALPLAGKWFRQIAPIAAPAGLSTFAVLSTGIGTLILKQYEFASRSQMYYRLARETIFWFALVAIGFVLTSLTAGIIPVFTSEPAHTDSEAQKEKASVSGFLSKIRNQKTINEVISLISASLLAIVILSLLNRSGDIVTFIDGRQVDAAGIPDRGQTLFAVVTAFLLASMASQQFLNTSLWSFLPAPFIVALFAYLTAAHNASAGPLNESTTLFILASDRLATVLPVQYAGLGSLAVISGYWLSLRTRRNRLFMAETTH